MTEAPPSPQERLATALRGVGSDEYGPSYRDHSLEIYKSYLEMTDRISERRQKTNAFFLAVNTALIALLAKDALGGSADPAPALVIHWPELRPHCGDVLLSYFLG